MNASNSFDVRRFKASDFAQWKSLAIAYKTFYKSSLTEEEYAFAFDRLIEGSKVSGFGAFEKSKLVGITHYFFHTTVWESIVCYLQDLYVDDRCRGRGVATELIEHVAQAATASGATKLYWLTQEDNGPARQLYDRVATFAGFIRYDYHLNTPQPDESR